jgi:hypothetical protein
MNYMILFKKKKKTKKAGHQWLMTITVATWEAEIRRIIVRGQPKQQK